MPLTLAPPDRQTTFAPRWVLESLVLPERYYGTKDLAFAVTVDGNPFIVGDSDVGGDDLVGGGAGGGDRPAHGNIMGDVVVTRSLVDVLGGQIEVQQFTIDLANKDGRLRGDYRGGAVKLWRYDEASRLTVLAVTGLISQGQRGRGTYRLLGTTLDRALLEALIPKGVITLEEFPLAAPDAVGQTPTWLFGNVPNLPLPNVRDDQIKSQFDYLVCRDAAAALTGLRRVMPGGVNPFITMTHEELEPYPGMDGAILNPSFEGWDAGATSNPDDWTTNAGATIAKNITPAQVSEGSASAALTRVGADCRLSQDLAVTALPFVPLTWWQGREITVVVDVHATVAARGLIRVSDGVVDFDSPFHTGGGTFEPLTVGTVALPCVISAAATRVRVEGRIHTGNTTVTFDNVRIYIRANNKNECLRRELYDGYTAIRTFLRQEEVTSGALDQLVADVKGLQPERNLVRAIRTICESEAHALGKTVSDASFDSEEIKACFTYDDAVRLDGPEVYLNLRDQLTRSGASHPPLGGVFHDVSGHERHATLRNAGATNMNAPGPSGDANDPYLDVTASSSYLTVPYDVRAGFQSPDAVTLECWYYINDTVVNALGFTRMLLEQKTAPGVVESGRWLSHTSTGRIQVGVEATGLGIYIAEAQLTAPADCNRWIHLVGTAEADGFVRIYKDKVLVASSAVVGTLLVGDGTDPAGVAFGGGFDVMNGAAAPLYRVARPALYSTALPAERVSAHFDAMALDVEPISSYDAEITARAPTFSYRMLEVPGDTVMLDETGAHSGVYNGGVVLGVAGPLAAARGFVNTSGAARFTNNVAQYGVETGMTLADAAATLVGFYRPSTLTAKSGLVEKTIGGVRTTQWGACHIGTVVRGTFVHAAGTTTLDIPLLTEDVARHGKFGFTWSDGTIEAYKNGALVATGTYTAPMASGVGDFLVGVQGTTGGPRTRPCAGDLGRWSYHPSRFTADDFAALWLAATWYPGGLCVDAALREPRQVQDWLMDICQVRGIRPGFTDGAITISVDAAAPTTIRLDARDGAGAGERTLIDAGPRTQTPLQNAVSVIDLSYRPDLLSGASLGRFTKVISPNRGKVLPITLRMIREHPSAWRALDYLAKRILYGDETVPTVLPQEARQLVPGDLVRLTDLTLDYDAAVLEARKVEDALDEVRVLLSGWDASIYVPDAIPFPSGAISG